MNDNSIMPYGAYQGQKMVNVPADYLLWLLEEKRASNEVKKYVEANKEVLEQQVANQKKA
jgi:uncharacterized protein (DUF3820 family)